MKDHDILDLASSDGSLGFTPEYMRQRSRVMDRHWIYACHRYYFTYAGTMFHKQVGDDKNIVYLTWDCFKDECDANGNSLVDLTMIYLGKEPSGREKKYVRHRDLVLGLMPFELPSDIIAEMVSMFKSFDDFLLAFRTL